MTYEELERIKSEYSGVVEQKRQAWRAEHNGPFYRNQTRLVLRNVGIIDANSIEEYIATEGYFGLARALGMSPEDIIDLVKSSGMRGRGGAGFPTGRKWEFVKAAEGDKKYVICNADEGDPGAFMDRMILEGDPHSVLEAMIIAGYAVGASYGYVYVRAEYPQAVKNVQAAVARARQVGLLGRDILGHGFSFDIEVRLRAGAYVCGEETALIASIEGKRGEPNPKPPFPATRGLYGKPTLINNVETLSAIPMTILKGAEYWNTLGSSNNTGTKVFALAGHVTNSGLVEVPMGTTIKRLIVDIGGCTVRGKAGDGADFVCSLSDIKAVQVGGPSGGCVPMSMFDLPLDFDSLGETGSILGSGGLVVMDKNTCMVDVAKFFTKFSVDESCGKCTPCRIGNLKLLNILEKISSGKGQESDLEELEKLSHVIKETSLCGLGQSSPNPVLSTLSHFRAEYLEHIRGGRCRAGVCRALVNYGISEKCIMCTLCVRTCPVGAITGELKQPHSIDKEKCIRCGKCVPICPVEAIAGQG